METNKVYNDLVIDRFKDKPVDFENQKELIKEGIQKYLGDCF